MNSFLFPPAFLSISESICSILWRASWQGAIGVLAITALCRLVPQLPATVRCWMWRLALLKFILTLLLPVALPLWVLPAKPQAARSLPAATAVVPSEKVGQIATTIQNAPASPALEDRSAQTSEPTIDKPVFLTAHTVQHTTPAIVRVPRMKADAPPVTIAPKAIAPLAALTGCLFSLYLIGFGVCAFRLARNTVQTARFLRSHCQACGDTVAMQDLATLRERIGGRKELRLVCATGIGSSQLVAGFPPLLLMPSDTTDIEAWRLMLAHELAHLQRYDLVWAAFSALTHALFFFHPGVWWARREEELAREIACDAIAITATRTSAARYGALLVEVVTQNRSNHPALRATASLGIANGTAQIQQRLIALQTLGVPVSARRLRPRLLVSALAALLALIPYRFVAAQNARQRLPLAPAMMTFGAKDAASLTGRLFYGKSKVPCTQASVQIKLLSDTPSSEEIGSWRGYTHADAEGRFAFPTLQPGRYHVLTRGEYGAWSPPASVQATVVTLKAQEHRVLPNIVLEQQVLVFGRIVDARTGQSVTDVEIAGGSADRDGQIAADADWQQVDSDGQYKAYVPAGKSAIYLRSRVRQNPIYTGRKWMSEYALPTSAGIIKTACVARQDRAMQRNIKVEAVPVLASTPVLPPIKGKVVGPDGRAIGGAQVFLFDEKNSGGIAPVVRSDAQGIFTIGNLDPKWAGEPLTIRARYAKRGLMAHPVSLALTASGTVPPVTVPLVAHLASSVQGRVVDALGHPFPFVIVNQYNGSINDHTMTDSEGRYQFAGLYPDQYINLEAAKTDYSVGPNPYIGGFSVGVDQRRQMKPLVLYPGDQSIAGRLTYQDGTPLTNVGLSATRGDSMFSHTDTDAQGRFRINHLSAGPLRLYFERGVAAFVEAKTGDLHLQVIGEGKSSRR